VSCSYRALLLGLLALSVACAEPEVRERTQVVAVVYADAELQTRLTRVDVEVRDETGAELASAHQFAVDPEAANFPLSFGVYQSESGASWFMLIARGMGTGDLPLVEYKVIAQFVHGKTGLLPVVLSINCLGVLCEGKATESCYANVGACVPVSRVMPELQVADAGPPDLQLPDAANDWPTGVAPTGDAGSTLAAPVPPSSHGFATHGGRRTDGKVTVYGDGFEPGDRRCTLDGNYCISGGLQP